MNLMKVFYKDESVDGVIVGEATEGLKMITTDLRSALIPKRIIKKIVIIRELSVKEEHEVMTIIKNREEIIQKTNEMKKLQQELDDLNSFNREQEAYVGCLIASNCQDNTNNADKLNLNNLKPNMPEHYFNALNYMIRRNMISINNTGDITVKLPDAGMYQQPTKKEFIQLLKDISENVLPMIGLFNQILYQQNI